ncbi:MAG: efflux RND transporter periplasmic adaptor subunit [Pseudomonadota bacterium]
MDRTSPWLLAIALLLTALPTAAAEAQEGGDAPPVPVTVVTLEAVDVTLTATLPGRVVASGVAEVRPQVDGIITERLFGEGADVTLGEPLYTIDDATYRAQLAAARAQVAQAEAQLLAAEREAERMGRLIERRVASEQNLDQAIAARDMAAAALEVAKAGRLAAEIDLERTTIKAPLSGVIGRSLTTQGALVTDGQVQPLAVIRTLDPVLVDVTQSAAEIIAWRRGLMAERLAGAEPAVSLILADGSIYEATGLLTAAEPYVHEQTGVVTLRLEFPNPDKLLLPGMYVQVELPQGVARGVVLAPQEGVSRDRRGRPTALVVGAGDVVEERVLEIVRASGSDWIVSDGLAAGDRLIVEGLQKVRPGAVALPEERSRSVSALGG